MSLASQPHDSTQLVLQAQLEAALSCLYKHMCTSAAAANRFLNMFLRFLQLLQASHLAYPGGRLHFLLVVISETKRATGDPLVAKSDAQGLFRFV